MGFVNQLITGGPHIALTRGVGLVGWYPATRHQAIFVGRDLWICFSAAPVVVSEGVPSPKVQQRWRRD